MTVRRRAVLLSAQLFCTIVAAPLVSPLAAAHAGLRAMDTVVFAVADTGSQRDPQGQFDTARFDTLTANALRALFDEAAAKGLPTAPLINRALEGAARRVGGARILSVVRAHAAALADAREALGDQSTVAELDAGATAIRAGIDPHTIAQIRAARPMGMAVTPLVVLTDVVRRGVPTSTAREAVSAIARIPRSDDALLGLQTTVAKNSQRGPGMALDALKRYVQVKVSAPASPSTPATNDRKPIRPPDS